MAENKKFTVRFRRRRENKTDYRRRLRLLVSRKQRLVIRKGLKNITAQIIDYNKDGDRVIVSANAAELRKLGWKGHLSNIPSSYLLGLLIGKKAKSKNIQYCILDSGINPSIKGSKIYTVLKGAIDSGLKIPYNENILPDEKRISGQHIQDYAKKLKNSGSYEKQFSGYIKNNLDVEDITKEFEKIKAKIMEK